MVEEHEGFKRVKLKMLEGAHRLGEKSQAVFMPLIIRSYSSITVKSNVQFCGKVEKIDKIYSVCSS